MHIDQIESLVYGEGLWLTFENGKPAVCNGSPSEDLLEILKSHRADIVAALQDGRFGKKVEVFSPYYCFMCDAVIYEEEGAAALCDFRKCQVRNSL